MCLMKANISGLILYKSADHNEMNFRIPKLLFPSICKFRIGIRGVRTSLKSSTAAKVFVINFGGFGHYFR